MSEDTYRNYLRDTIQTLRDTGLRCASEQRRAPSDFNAGQAMAYYEVLSLLRENAKTFGLPLSELALADPIPEREFL